MSALTITHTHEAGTLIDGTSRGDGSAPVLKANGWRWGRSIGAWYVPHSRDRIATGWKIDQTAEALRVVPGSVSTSTSTTPPAAPPRSKSTNKPAKPAGSMRSPRKPTVNMRSPRDVGQPPTAPTTLYPQEGSR